MRVRCHAPAVQYGNVHKVAVVPGSYPFIITSLVELLLSAVVI